MQYCTKCGSKQYEEPVVKGKLCDKCHVELKPEYLFCSMCGNKVGDSSDEVK